MSEENTQITLRDTIETAFNEAQKEPVVETVQAEKPETTEQKSDRIRDEQGRFAEGKADKPKVDKTSTPVVTQEVSRPQRPSSWKKDYWDHWDKLDPKLAEYLVQREQEFAKGVSTYKTEADRAKEIFDAIAPYQQYINIRGGNAKQVLSNLLQTASAFTNSDPQSRLSALLQVAQQFDIPIQQAFQGDQGQSYLVTLANELNGLKSEWKNFQTSRERSEYQQLSKQVDAFGKDHEHLDQVRETMAGLLQAGLADDLESAYQAAIRLPRHSDIFDSMQAQKLAQDEAKKKEESARLAASARAKAVSPKSSTPAGVGKSAGSKGIRDILESAIDEHSGRV